MNNIFNDNFIERKLLKRAVREIKKQQLDITINELNYLNEIQNHMISKYEFTKKQNQGLSFTKKVNNAGRKNKRA